MVHPAFVVVDVVNAMITALEKEEDQAELAFFDEERKATDEQLEKNLTELQELIHQASLKVDRTEAEAQAKVEAADVPSVQVSLPRPPAATPFDAEIKQSILAYQSTVKLINDLNGTLDSLFQMENSVLSA
mmetsp:Transcript_24421/g.34471  ORF Transcript_24421/g.34471 Transcript_24421/m.34471 type:complete len:131 (-) Transcript_24421:173-565(-)|eukprot:CAMPEP_0175091590 /NCGR_PEP_ID=MMETSP0086_2-20121207/1985_1 /TAXON_ID=136419 /ORGANISM="Unknown Unknown, Strain D1" /LENGTH=130 /DNA_ID=CAMNT_0016364345 /DNA_START=43 /DNA_END=435 /DNA_ORIENTATION=+